MVAFDLGDNIVKSWIEIPGKLLFISKEFFSLLCRKSSTNLVFPHSIMAEAINLLFFKNKLVLSKILSLIV